MKRLAVITTHPIQYNAPFFSLLARRGFVHVKVFYTWGKSVAENKYDPGFKRNIDWDIPLFEDYEYCFVQNLSVDPGSHHFSGIVNPLLNNEIENWKADVILVYGWSFNSHVKCIKYFFKKIPVLFRGDSTLLDEQPLYKRVLRFFFLTWLYKHIDFAFYTGTNNKRYFEYHNVQQKKLVFAPHAVDNERFTDSVEKGYEIRAAEWRHRLFIKPTDIVFLFAGKLEEKKDPLLLINAFISIKNEDLHLVIVGDGELEPIIKEKEGKNIHLIGFQNQHFMPIIYRIADCFVLPSKGPGETWGLAVNEAMACGRPVIASDKCGCAVDLITDAVNGFIFCSGSETDLKSKLEMFIAEKKKGNNMKGAALRTIQPWSLEEICKQVENIVG